MNKFFLFLKNNIYVIYILLFLVSIGALWLPFASLIIDNSEKIVLHKINFVEWFEYLQKNNFKLFYLEHCIFLSCLIFFFIWFVLILVSIKIKFFRNVLFIFPFIIFALLLTSSIIHYFYQCEMTPDPKIAIHFLTGFYLYLIYSFIGLFSHIFLMKRKLKHSTHKLHQSKSARIIELEKRISALEEKTQASTENDTITSQANKKDSD